MLSCSTMLPRIRMAGGPLNCMLALWTLNSEGWFAWKEAAMSRQLHSAHHFCHRMLLMHIMHKGAERCAWTL